MHPIMTTKPTAGLYKVKENARRLLADQWFLNALPSFYIAGQKTGVDPVVMAAQSALETGWGKFGGAVYPEQGNTGGFKTRDGSGFHTFPMEYGIYPHEGALAHAYHLAAYAGVYYPEAFNIDPRYIYLAPDTRYFGIVDFVEELGGVHNGIVRWASDPEYGRKIASTYERLTET